MIWSIKDSAHEVLPDELFVHHRTVRNIVAEFELQPSSRILISGDSPKELTDYLEFLGIDVILEKEASRDSLAQEQVISFSQFGKKMFNAVVVFIEAVSPRSLFSREALQSTATHLRSIHPLGHFVFAIGLKNRSFSSLGNEAHREECFVKHLSCFPGKISQGRPTSGFLSFSRLEIPEYMFLSLRVPHAEAYPRNWFEFVNPSLSIHPGACCEFSEEVAQPRRDWNQAA